MTKHTKHNPDYLKNKTADVVKHGDGPAIANQHWEVMKKPTNNRADTPADAFLPKSGKDRPVPHEKVNECDH